MKNLIYLNKENFKQDSFLSKLKYLACEFTLYFDGDDKIRKLGFGIAEMFYPNLKVNEKYSRLLKLKKNLTIGIRCIALVFCLGLGIYLFYKSQEVNKIYFLVIFSILGGGLFLFPYNTDILERVDKWKEHLDLSDKIFKVVTTSQCEIIKKDISCTDARLINDTLNNLNINSKGKLITNDNLLVDENNFCFTDNNSLEEILNNLNRRVTNDELNDFLNHLKKKENLFNGTPIDEMIFLLNPLRSNDFEKKLILCNADFLKIIIFLVTNDKLKNPIILKPRTKEIFKAYFHTLYAECARKAHLKGEFEDKFKDKFCNFLSNLFADFEGIKKESLRVHSRKINFAGKLVDYFVLLNQNK